MHPLVYKSYSSKEYQFEGGYAWFRSLRNSVQNVEIEIFTFFINTINSFIEN
jgi:hypothetical protein